MIIILYRLPIHYAAFRAHIDKLRLLLNPGSNTNAVDENGYTPMHYCAFSDTDGRLFVYFCLINEHLSSCLKELYRNGADCFARDKYGLMPVHYSVYANNGIAVELVCE